MSQPRQPRDEHDPIAELLRSRHPEPHKTLEELAREQGLLDQPIPDYGALATAVWPTEEDVEDFIQYLEEIRNRKLAR